MDISEIRALSDADLAAQLLDAKQELWKIRFDLATRQEKNYSRLPATRKRIARILTVMTEREHAADAARGAGDETAAPEPQKAAS
jgi:large subunit ribosomal protein L29